MCDQQLFAEFRVRVPVACDSAFEVVKATTMMIANLGDIGMQPEKGCLVGTVESLDQEHYKRYENP